MPFFIIGLNHKTAPVGLREHVYFKHERTSLYLQDLLAWGHTQEAVLLSTCNRSELYCDTQDLLAVRDWFMAQSTLSQADIEQALYVYQGEAAVNHLMQVACGLDSMILGEPQILGQLKEAFSESCSSGSVGPLLHRLFQQVFAVAKEVRTTTAIGACPVSVASAAIQYAKTKFRDFTTKQVVLIGAGDTAALLMRYLKQQLEIPIRVVNRHLEKALQLTQQFGGEAYSWDQLSNVLATADIVFSATGSVTPIVTPYLLRDLNRTQSLTFFDLAVPRDIAPEVKQLSNIYVYDIDTLRTVIEHNRQGRAHAAEKAWEMIAQKSKAFMVYLQSIDKVSYTIRAYRGHIESLCEVELHKAKQRLQQGMDPEQVLASFSYAFMQKLLHTPSVKLRQAGVEGKLELLYFAKQLFAIPDLENDTHETFN